LILSQSRNLLRLGIRLFIRIIILSAQTILNPTSLTILEERARHCIWHRLSMLCVLKAILFQETFALVTFNSGFESYANRKIKTHNVVVH